MYIQIAFFDRGGYLKEKANSSSGGKRRENLIFRTGAVIVSNLLVGMGWIGPALLGPVGRSPQLTLSSLERLLDFVVLYGPLLLSALFVPIAIICLFRGWNVIAVFLGFAVPALIALYVVGVLFLGVIWTFI